MSQTGAYFIKTLKSINLQFHGYCIALYFDVKQHGTSKSNLNLEY